MLVLTHLLLQTSLSPAWTLAIFPSLVSLLAVKPPFYLFIMLLLDYLSNIAQIDSFSVITFSIISGELLDLPCVPVYLVQVVIMTHIPQHFATRIYTTITLYLTASPLRADAIIYLSLSLIHPHYLTQCQGYHESLVEYLLNK